MFDNLEYLILLAVVCFLLVFRKKTIPNQKKYISAVVCIALIVFAGFRLDVGTDYPGYSKMFEKILAEGRYYEIEWGYYWLVQIVAAIGGNAQMVFFLFSFFTLFFICKFIEYFSEDAEISWLVFLCIGPYFLSTFNGIRQWLSTAIFAYSLRYVKEQNFKKYLILNAISSLFHYSSVILIPMYWLLTAKNFSLGKIAVTYIVFQLASMLGIITFIAEKLHASSYTEGEAMFELDWSYYLFFAMALGFIFLQTVMPQIAEDFLIFKNLNALSGLSVFLAITTSGMSNMIFTRFNVYFFIGYIILVPAVLIRIKTPTVKHLATTAVVVLVMAYYFYVTSTAMDLLPYKMTFKLFG